MEDPVEYKMDGVNQVSVNVKRGLTFAAALRSILRQDPDKVMIGEIRDTETIEIAVKAALTGHLVLSTLHTNDAPSTITRMVDMGVDPFMISSSTLLIAAQRLVRKLCEYCREPIETPPKERLVELGFHRGGGGGSRADHSPAGRMREVYGRVPGTVRVAGNHAHHRRPEKVDPAWCQRPRDQGTGCQGGHAHPASLRSAEHPCADGPAWRKWSG